MTKANIAQWDTTAANNEDINDISLAENVMKPPAVNNTFRETMAQIAQWTGEGTIASAATCNIGAENQEFLNVTGTTTITSFGTVRAGTKRRLLFAGALTLTHNATSLILPGAANITTAAGDVATFVSEGSGNWRCVSYERALLADLLADLGLTKVAKTDQAQTFAGTQTFTSEPVVGGGSRYIRIESSAPNSQGRGLWVEDDAGNIAGLVQIAPNAVGSSSIMEFFVGGNAGGDRWLTLDDTGRLRSIGTYGSTTGSAANLVVSSSDGSFLRSTSSRRYKKDFADFGKSVEDFASLVPKTYASKAEVDGAERFAGLISEEIDEAGFGIFVERGDDGQPEGIMYGPLGAVGVAVLAKRIVELEERIKQLEAKV